MLALSGSSLRGKRVLLTLLAKVDLSNSLKWSCDSALSRLGPPPSWLAGSWVPSRGNDRRGRRAFRWRTIHPYTTKVEQKLHATSTCIVAAEWTIFFQGLLSPGCDWPGKKGEGGMEKKRKVRTSGGRESEWWSWIETRADKNRKQSSWLELRPSRLWREATSRRTWLSVWFAVSSAQVKPLTVFRARELRRFPRSSALLVDGEVCGRMCVAWEEG